MNEPLLETLSAFADGEVVEPERLAEALAQEGAREALVDFAAIRALAAADRSEPPSWAGAEIDLALRQEGASGRSRTGQRFALAAAASVLFAVGVMIGSRLEPPRIAEPTARSVAPPATREVRFIEGVDWFREGSGVGRRTGGGLQ